MSANRLQPLTWNTPIANSDGTPTNEFQRKWKLLSELLLGSYDPLGAAAAVAALRASDTVFGLVEVDGTTITSTDGVISAAGGGGGLTSAEALARSYIGF